MLHPIFLFAALLTLADMLPLAGESIVQTYRHKKTAPAEPPAQ